MVEDVAVTPHQAESSNKEEEVAGKWLKLQAHWSEGGSHDCCLLKISPWCTDQ